MCACAFTEYTPRTSLLHTQTTCCIGVFNIENYQRRIGSIEVAFPFHGKPKLPEVYSPFWESQRRETGPALLEAGVFLVGTRLL